MIEFKSEAEFREWFEKPLVLRKYGIRRVLWSQESFPDLKFETASGRVVLAEVELRTSNFDLHKHDGNQVDLVIAWIHDQPHRKRHFKVLGVSLNETTKGKMTVDKILRSKEDLVYKRLSRLPLIATKSLDGEDFRLIKRYRKAWKLINQSDINQLFTADLEELVRDFQSYIEVDKNEFFDRANHFKEWFPNRVFHPFLCFMAKAIVLRGTLKLINDGMLPLEGKHRNPVIDIHSISKRQYLGLHKLIERRKLAFGLGVYPFASYEERMGFFCTDYLDAFIHNFNFRASSRLPAKHIALILQEITIWKKFGEKGLSEEEALKHYGLKKSPRKEFNPLKREFSPAKIVSFSWRLASRLREYGFVEPEFSEEIVTLLYDFIVQPIGVITHADKMPKATDIEFFFYPQDRVWDVLRRFETTRGFTRRDGEKALRRFYQEYPSHIEVN